jgi:hypothetical protein
LTDQVKSSKFDYTPGESNRKLENLKKISTATPKPMNNFGSNNNNGGFQLSPNVKTSNINSIVNNDPNLVKLGNTPPIRPNDGFSSNAIRLQPPSK